MRENSILKWDFIHESTLWQKRVKNPKQQHPKTHKIKHLKLAYIKYIGMPTLLPLFYFLRNLYLCSFKVPNGNLITNMKV